MRSGTGEPQKLLRNGQQVRDSGGRLGWRLRVRDPRRAGRQVERTFYGSVSEARKSLDRLREEVERGVSVPLATTNITTFEEACALWLESYKYKGRPSISPRKGAQLRPTKTWDKAKSQVNTNIMRVIPRDSRLKRLTVDDFANVIDTMITEGSAPGTVETTLSVLRSLGRDLHALGLTSVNLAGNLRTSWATANREVSPKEVPTPQEVEKLAKCLDEIWEDRGNIVRFLAYSGLRFEEAAALKWTDVDFKARKISVRRTAVWTSLGREERESTKTQASWRDVVMLSDANKALKQLEKRTGEKSEYVLAGERGGPLSYSLWRRYLKRAREKSGVDITAHGLRHYFATITLASGAPVQEVSSLLGHTTSVTTEGKYRQFITQDLRERAAELDRLLGAAKRKTFKKAKVSQR